MKLDFAIFAFHASVRPDGLFSVLEGGLAWITAPGFPAATDTLALLARIGFDPNECGRQYTCKLKIELPSGDIEIPEMVVAVNPVLHPYRVPQNYTALFRFGTFVFPVAGLYRFGIFVDDNRVGDAVLEAIEESNS